MKGGFMETTETGLDPPLQIMTLPMRDYNHVWSLVLLTHFCCPTEVWAAQPTTGEKPPPLDDHTFTKIDNHRAVVFGGYTGSSRVNDTYVLDMETWVWMCACLYTCLNGNPVQVHLLT